MPAMFRTITADLHEGLKWVASLLGTGASFLGAAAFTAQSATPSSAPGTAEQAKGGM